MNRLFYFLILFCVSGVSLAQDIEVKKFEPMVKDRTAALSSRKDINGTVCGLIKVQLKEPGAEFEGNVMGDVQFTGSEYLVYLPNGTKRLGIKHPDYLPTTIVFADYGTKRIVSATTYELKLKTNKKKEKVDNSKKGMVAFNINPSNAMLLIDGQVADGASGVYSLSLPYGTHYYTVKTGELSINNQIIHIDKVPKTIDIDLMEYFVKLDVDCPTEDAVITINGEQKGLNHWGGSLAPGHYTIEASKSGFHSQSRQIEMKEDEDQTVNFSELKQITGSLRVDYGPAGCDVLLNGQKIGQTPLFRNDIPEGNYQLEISKKYYIKQFSKVRIEEDREWNEKGKLKLTELGTYILGANKDFKEGGEMSSCLRLAEYYRYGAVTGWRGREYSPCSEDSFYVSINPIESVRILKKIIKDENGLNSEDAIEEAKSQFGPLDPSEPDDGKISFSWAMNFEDYNSFAYYYYNKYGNNQYATLAWHYYYGVACEKNIETAREMMRKACDEEGCYYCPAWHELIEKLGLKSELKYKQYNYEDCDTFHSEDYYDE